MKKISYISILLLFSACAGFQTATLTEEQPLAQLDSAAMNAPSLAVLNYNNGVFYDKKTDIGKWEASHSNISVEKSGSSLVVDLKGVGNDWEQLSRKFQPLDFTNAPFLILKARIDIGSKDSLKMRIDLIDEDGNATNYVPQERYIRTKADAKQYKFIYAGNWVQNWPSRKDVNSKSIVEIKINFNGGGPNYTGKLVIDEIFVSDGIKKAQNPENYALFDFTDGTS